MAEWQTGRVMDMPASFEKIRTINTTLASLVEQSGKERAANAREILSKIRSLQQTLVKDSAFISEETKSIHGAKTLMNAHTSVLTQYVQGFESMRGTLVKKFGQASTDESANDLMVALAVAQAYSDNQTITHERLAHRMLKNLSRLTTRMALVSQSMSQLVTQVTEAELTKSDGEREQIEKRIEEKISAIQKTLEPCVMEIEEIDAQLLLAHDSDPALLIENQMEKVKYLLLPAPDHEVNS